LVVCHKQAATWGHIFFSGQCVAQKSMDIYADACGNMGVLTCEGDVSPRTSNEIYADVVRARAYLVAGLRRSRTLWH